MPRKLSSIAPDWWDYTTLEENLIRAAAGLTPEAMLKLTRHGFKVVMYDTLEEFYLAEALEYINAWKQSTPDNPVGICGPIGPTEQLPLVARIVNELNLPIQSAHFWGMDEWFVGDKEVPVTHPLYLMATCVLAMGVSVLVNTSGKSADKPPAFPRGIEMVDIAA